MVAISGTKTITATMVISCIIIIVMSLHHHHRCTIIAVASSSSSCRCTIIVAAPSSWLFHHHRHVVVPSSWLTHHHHRHVVASSSSLHHVAIGRHHRRASHKLSASSTITFKLRISTLQLNIACRMVPLHISRSASAQAGLCLIMTPPKDYAFGPQRT